MKRALLLVAIGIACAVSLACQPGAAGLTDQDKAAIRRSDEALSRTAFTPKPDWITLAAEAYAEDAELLPPGESRVAGMSAIKAWYADWPRFKDFKIKEVRLEGLGGLAFRHIAYVATADVPTASGEPPTDEGKDIAVFRKGPDGKWKIVSECWNGNAPPSDIIVPTGPVARDASAEVRKLGDMVGHWKFEGTAKADPKAASGTVVLDATVGWFAGGRQVVYRFSGTMGGAPYEEVGVYVYDAKAKVYTFYSMSNDGNSGLGTLTIQPGSWVHTAEMQAGGKPAKARFELLNMSREGGAWKSEVSVGGEPWIILAEGKYVEAK